VDYQQIKERSSALPREMASHIVQYQKELAELKRQEVMLKSLEAKLKLEEKTKYAKTPGEWVINAAIEDRLHIQKLELVGQEAKVEGLKMTWEKMRAENSLLCANSGLEGNMLRAGIIGEEGM
jgi:hypothetical protein